MRPWLKHRTRELWITEGAKKVDAAISRRDVMTRSDQTMLEARGIHSVVFAPLAEAGIPVDAYGVGSSLIRGSNDFTADVVMVDERGNLVDGDQLLYVLACDRRGAEGDDAVARISGASPRCPRSSG